MRILGIIPSRFASTRFPGKPLAVVGGVSMIERVYRQALKAGSLAKLVVATDDERIADTVRAFGGEVVMTSTDHPSGTDRCAEVLQHYQGEYQGVINIQGDEPFIRPGQINLLAEALSENGVGIATLVKQLDDAAEAALPQVVKVVLAANGDALYFSRQWIPFVKDAPQQEWTQQSTVYKHIGIYGYRTDVLPQLTLLPQGQLEKAESLEQLRWLEQGFRIRTRVTAYETIAIDTPEDLVKAEAYFQALPDSDRT